VVTTVKKNERDAEHSSCRPACFSEAAPFWPHSPALWFSQAECLFTVRQLTDEFQRYCHVVGALPHGSLRLVADLVEAPPQENMYTAIKEGRLLSSHQMTPYQRAKKLFALPALASRKPSDLMASMNEICPRGEEKTLCVPFSAKTSKGDPRAPGKSGSQGSVGAGRRS
jgi:hypothetical protein